jgi:hypothetical protein
MPLMVCTGVTFQLRLCDGVRWLQADKDYDLAADFWSRRGVPLSREQWDEAHHMHKYRYAATMVTIQQEVGTAGNSG